MPYNKNYTAIPVFRNTWMRLNKLKTSENTWDMIVNDLLDRDEKSEQSNKEVR
jgi:hypothetical protein